MLSHPQSVHVINYPEYHVQSSAAGQRIRWLAIWFAAIAASTANAEELTIGSPAPPLKIKSFLKGEPVQALAKGTVYVVEFSGTGCVPCIKAIPHLTDLQKKHSKVVLISVYSEAESEVRAFLEKHQNQMGFRVALDQGNSTESRWMRGANLQGIPTVFVVNAEEVLTWIGHPSQLDEPLEKTIAGTIDLRLERARLAFVQADSVALTESIKRQQGIAKAHQRLYELARKQKWEESIQTADQAAREFPEAEFQFLNSKLYVLAENPKSTDQALRFAASLSAKMRFSDRYINDRQHQEFDAAIAQSLLNHRMNPDPLLAEAASILVKKADRSALELKDEDERLLSRKYIRQVSAMIAAGNHDFAKAATLQGEALHFIRQRKCRETTPQSRKDWEQEQNQHIGDCEAELAKYEALAGKSKTP